MIRRNNTYFNDIIYVDGISGVGKSLLSQLISFGNNVEKQRTDETMGYICVLNHLKLLSENDAATTLQLLSDLATYNSYISREINLRFYDVSSVFRNPKKFKYLKNLLRDDTVGVVDEILKFKPKLNIISHNIFQVSKPLLKAFGNRLKIILVVRNPVYILKDWSHYLERIGKDPGELTPAVGEKGEYPWFAENLDEYKKLRPFEKAINCLNSLTKLQEQMENSGLFDETNLLVIPYESFVFESEKWVDNICYFLKLNNVLELKKYLPKIGCPRKSLNETSNKWRKLSRKILLNEKKQKNSIFKKKDSLTDLEINFYKKSLLEIKSNSSDLYFKKFIKINENYISKYHFERTMPWEAL